LLLQEGIGKRAPYDLRAAVPVRERGRVPDSKPVDALMQIPAHRGQSFRRIADSVPVIADSF
jgi:hypothetical protein